MDCEFGMACFAMVRIDGVTDTALWHRWRESMIHGLVKGTKQFLLPKNIQLLTALKYRIPMSQQGCKSKMT